MHTLDSARVYLRGLNDDDVTDRYLSWFSDEDVTRYLEIKSLTREDALKFLHHGRETGKYHLYGIVLKEDDRLVGTVKIRVVNKDSGIYAVNTVVGDKSVWGRGIATHAILIANNITFQEYRARKIVAGIYADHIGSLKAYMNAGWVIEGRQVGHYIVDGEVKDGLWIACFNDIYFDYKDGAYTVKASEI
ncbi:MAG: GNAT family N-acetyltransferase [Rhodospirillaceae bacterium]|nr:GNAT family N-acetyltransferase [Rhodospirillaceae bacterium]MBT4220510.1 GNAT family N-acetyltransferase [Rhodospirillaceae bacterium]MBT5309372.1 GNAT family N-acetyltransferase [Rhodospirillaceae bacterium]